MTYRYDYKVRVTGSGPFSGELYEREYTVSAANREQAVFMAGVLFVKDDNVPDYLVDMDLSIT